MDGGMRTVANADLPHGYERVVIVAPVAAGIGFMASLCRQAAALTAAGARVALVRPHRAAVRAIGRNVLDVSRREPEYRERLWPVLAAALETAGLLILSWRAGGPPAPHPLEELQSRQVGRHTYTVLLPFPPPQAGRQGNLICYGTK